MTLASPRGFEVTEAMEVTGAPTSSAPALSAPTSSEPTSAPWDSIKVLCLTWNMGDARPLEDELEHWLPAKGGSFDLVAVGVQECSYDSWMSASTPKSSRRTPKKRKSLKGSSAVQLPMLSGATEELLHTFGSSPSRADLSPDPQVRDLGEEAFSFHWDDILAERLGDGFVRVQQVVLMSMRLLVFARAEYCDGSLTWRGGPIIHTVQQTYSATGLLAGTVGNKGGLVVSLHFGPVSLCFVSCHLAAHMNAADKRDSDCREILQETWPVCHPHLDIACQFDHCFWFGDLNYRIDLNMSGAVQEYPTVGLGKAREDGKMMMKVPSNPCFASHEDNFAAIVQLASDGKYEELMAYDQLLHHKNAGKAFAGFQEGTPGFGPTFKVERALGSHYVQERAPSYCDRILWKSLPPHQGDMTQHLLTSVPEVSSSDHKPVLAHFEITPCPQLGALLHKPMSKDCFPVVRLSNFKARDLNTAGPSSNPYLVFLVTPLELNADEGVSAVQKGTSNPEWKDQELPVLRPAATNQDELSSCALLVIVYSKSVKLGHVALRFPGWEPSHSDKSNQCFRCSFEEPIILHNQTAGVGVLAGSLEVDWSDAAIRDANEAAKNSTPEKHHKVCPSRCTCSLQ